MRIVIHSWLPRNLAYLEVRRKQETPRRLRQFPRELDHSSESARNAKKAGSVPSEDKRGFDKPPALLSEEFRIYDCANCCGLHKSINCTKACRLCKESGNDAKHIQYLCPEITNAKERKRDQQPLEMHLLDDLDLFGQQRILVHGMLATVSSRY